MEAFAILIIGAGICFLLDHINNTLVEIVTALNYNNQLKYEEWQDDYRQDRIKRVNPK